MRIVLRHVPDCPNWETTQRHLDTLIEEGLEATVEYELVDTQERAEELGFLGSPTVLLDGIDPFGVARGKPGLACRIYFTEQGRAGSPTLDQLREVTTALMESRRQR